MNVLIIEDEPNAARQLRDMVMECKPAAKCYDPIDSVSDAVAFLNAKPLVDLLFLDIHLSDGHAFEIFEHVEVPCPIIFTTAYDQYALKAFEVNSIDYLLKPMNTERVAKALHKFEQHYGKAGAAQWEEHYFERLHRMFSGGGGYKQSFLIPYKDKLLPVQVKDFAWFEIQQSVITGKTSDGSLYTLEERSLDDLSKALNPAQFFRANRQFLVNKTAVKEVVQYFNGKLLLKLALPPAEKVVVSREKVSFFKTWLTA